MNKIFDKLVKSKIEEFVYAYKNVSKNIFVNDNGQLIHPGEFGMYREQIVSELLKPFLPSHLSIGTGFIITSHNNISTQCDLIIYDVNYTPKIENNNQRFFPIECVAGVIEVKSQLNSTTLKNALVKLSNIKKLRNDIAKDTTCEYGRPKFDINNNIRDSIATCLICESINIDKNINLQKYFDNIYKGIDRSLYHNMILSLDNYCFLYEKTDVKMLNSYPYIGDINNPHLLLYPSKDGYKYEHILVFLNMFFMLIYDVSIVYLEITYYLGPKRKFEQKI